MSLDKIEYLSSATNSAGEITLRYLVHRTMPTNDADPAPPIHDASETNNAPLSGGETIELNRITSQLLNVQTEPDMEAEMTKRRSHETAFEELKTIVAGPCTLVGGTDLERAKALIGTHNSMKCMYATLDNLQSADDNDVGKGSSKNELKQGLREMIDEFLALVTRPAHPWPPEMKAVVISLMRGLADQMDGTTPPVTPSDTPSARPESDKQRWKQVLTMASSYMRTDDTEDGALGSCSGKKAKRRQITPLPRQDTENGELNTVFLMSSIDKIRLGLLSIKSTIDPEGNATSDRIKAIPISRNDLKDAHDELTEFLDRWSKPTPKDKLAAEQLQPGVLADELVYFSQMREKIDTWFNNNLRSDTSPTDTPDKSPN